MPAFSRFTQLLIICCLVIFLPTFLYLRPSSSAIAPLSPLTPHLSTQGSGPLSNDSPSSWQWPGEKWLDPAKLKAGDYWKSWKDGWAAKGAGVAAGGIQQQQQESLPASPSSSSTTTTTTTTSSEGGAAFASKMANQTAKEELGRATWKFLHTMTLRFPDNPTPDQRATLSSFFQSFALLYPCGECANHFQQLLKTYPPQTSSRMGAAMWLCSMHNIVNARLGKEDFPCDKLDEKYDCGCGPPSATSATGLAALGPLPTSNSLLANLPTTPAHSQPPVVRAKGWSDLIQPRHLEDRCHAHCS